MAVEIDNMEKHMLDKKSQEFKLILDYLGHGDAKNGLWFIGVEAGGEWPDNPNTSQNIVEEFGNPVREYETKSPRPDGYQKWPVAISSAKIAAAVNNQWDDWRRYRDEYLWVKGYGVFNGNILPISRPNLNSWKPHYQSLLGISQQEYKKSFDQIVNYREKLFNDFIEQNKPQAIVCFGKSHWGSYRKFFIADEHQLPTKDIASSLVFHKDRVILTRHFSNGMSDGILAAIGCQLQQWGVELP